MCIHITGGDMNKLIAKPVVKDNYWIVTDGDKKVGNVLATGTGFDVKVYGQSKHFINTKTIQTVENIVFLPIEKRHHKDLSFAKFPTSSRIFNSVFDVKRKLHLFTRSKQSKCFHVAGWFTLGNDIVLCPKYIFINRYPYQGPFKTKEEAIAALNMRSD